MMRGLLQREPVRVYLYGIVVSVVALLSTLDVITDTAVNPILAVGAAVLAVPAVEVARRKVSPTATVNHTDGHAEPQISVFEEVRLEEKAAEEAELESWLDDVVSNAESDV